MGEARVGEAHMGEAHMGEARVGEARVGGAKGPRVVTATITVTITRVVQQLVSMIGTKPRDMHSSHVVAFMHFECF
jgi:hypothetical protein